MTCPVDFEILSTDGATSARTGLLKLRRATVRTPVFMPVGTQAALRAMPPNFLAGTKTQLILANAYHLHQRPGEELVQKMGGLHRFMAVDLPILTDSGGFQVFSLKKQSVSDEGVRFRYEVDGKETFLSPEVSMGIQQALGSDIAMAFDECLPADASQDTVRSSIDRTARWAERSLAAHTRTEQCLFGIVQGGIFKPLRERSAEQITNLPFDGFAIGGLAVGEERTSMLEMVGYTTERMPAGKPRYLMGVGRPRDLIDCVRMGVDMFDCVIPTRHARSGMFYTTRGRLRLTDRRFRRDGYPPDTSCNCYTCSNFSRAYLHHLFKIGEVLGATLAVIHNLSYFEAHMERIRTAIDSGELAEVAKEIESVYPS